MRLGHYVRRELSFEPAKNIFRRNIIAGLIEGSVDGFGARRFAFGDVQFVLLQQAQAGAHDLAWGLEADLFHLLFDDFLLASYGLRHRSGWPWLDCRTLSTIGSLSGFSCRARFIACACVGNTSLARSEFGRRTA